MNNTNLIVIAFTVIMYAGPSLGEGIIKPPAMSPDEIAKVCPSVKADPSAAKAPPYDHSQPGADDASVKSGFDAFKAGSHENALAIWEPHAISGNATAQYFSGILFHGDGGKEESLPCAIAWFQTAAAQGHLGAIAKLGILKGVGNHEFVDHAEALSLLKFAAAQCNLDAQFQLGSFYGRTQKPYRDFVEAHKWLMIATARGHTEAKDTNKILRRFTSVAELREGNRRHKEWLRNNTCP